MWLCSVVVTGGEEVTYTIIVTGIAALLGFVTALLALRLIKVTIRDAISNCARIANRVPEERSVSKGAVRNYFAVPFETAFGLLRNTAKLCAITYCALHKSGLAWFFISTAISLIAFRRSIESFRLFKGDPSLTPNPIVETYAVTLALNGAKSKLDHAGRS